MIVRDVMRDHKRVIFNGNNYSQEWLREAEARGLPNIDNAVDAAKALISQKNIDLFQRHGVFSRKELESRYEIQLESYAKTVNIEARTMIDMATKQIIPAVISYTTELAQSLNAVREVCPEADVSVQKEILVEVSALLARAKVALTALKVTQAQGSLMEDGKDKAFHYRRTIVPAMEHLRTPVDELEMLVDKKFWPMPSYGDLIFEV